MTRNRTRALAVFLALGTAWACGSDKSTAPAATAVLAVSAGASQTAMVGHAVGTPPSVTVTVNSQLAAAVLVTFTVTGGGGSVTGATVKTDSTGTAAVGSWTLGTVAGTNTITATVAGSTPVAFTATGIAGAAATITKASGDGQSVVVGSTLTSKPAVLVADQYGNVVAGAQVTFSLTGGGGTLTGAIATTGPNGVATLGGWTLGTAVGTNSLTASVAGVSTVAAFSETGTAGAVATLTKVAGTDNLSAVIGSALATAPAVRLADQFGNLVVGQTATFAVASGGGSVTGATPVSSAIGIATVGGWTLGSTLGPNTLTASSGTAPSVTFTATGTVAFNASQYAGTYTGNWTNTTFGSTGTTSATVSVNSASSTMSIAFVVTGQVLGTGGVNTTQSGLYSSNGAAVSNIVVPVMGTVNFAIDAVGNITASGTNIPNQAINKWNAGGTITATQVRMTYTVTFNDGTTGVGTISLNHS